MLGSWQQLLHRHRASWLSAVLCENWVRLVCLLLINVLGHTLALGLFTCLFHSDESVLIPAADPDQTPGAAVLV